jgi:hypothetical protein
LRLAQTDLVQAHFVQARFAQQSSTCVAPACRPVWIDREPERAAMPISDMPIFSMLRTKMH